LTGAAARLSFDPTMGVRFVVRLREGKKTSSEVEFPFDQTRVVLGRGQAADVRIPHRSVSEFHATVQLRNDGWFLADAESTNGTKCNGARVRSDRPKRLRDGDLIELGVYVLSFHTGVLVPEPVSAERTAELARRLLREAYGDRAQPLAGPRLVVSAGPDQGAEFAIPAPPSRALIGRGPACQLVLQAQGLALEHAELIHDLDGVLLRALSENTFLLAGQALRARRLRAGDEVLLGETRLVFSEPAQAVLDALRHEPDLPYSGAASSETQTALLEPDAAPPAGFEFGAGAKPGTASERPDADLLIYALAAVVLIASTLGLLLLLRAQ